MRYTYILIFIFIITLITSSGYKSSTEQSYNNNFENESKLINNTSEDVSFPSNFSQSDSFLTYQAKCDVPSNSSGILCITTSGLNGVVLDQTQKFLIVIESTGGNPNPQQISVTGQELKDFRVEVPQGTYSVLVKQQTNVGDLDPEFIDVTFDEDILLLSGQCTNESINIQQVNRCVIIFSQFGEIFSQFGETQSQNVGNQNDLRQGVTTGTRVDEPPEQFGIVQGESIFSPSSPLSFSKMILDGKVGFVNLKNKILQNTPINITSLACFEGEAYPLINNLREINCNNILIMTGSQYSIENKDKNVELENKFIFNYSNNTYFYSLRNALDNGISESLFTCSFMNNYIPNSLQIIEKPCEYIFIAYN